MPTASEILERLVGGRGVAAAAVVDSDGRLDRDRNEPVFLAYSITKTIVATLILQMDETGGLHLEDMLSRWFPQLPGADRITLRRMLNHTAGIPDYGPLPQYHEAVRRHPTEPWSFDRFIAETIGKGLAFEPGNDWAYSNPGYMLLKRVAELVSGMSFAELVSSRIAGPLQLERFFVAESISDLASLAPAPSKYLWTDWTIRDTRQHYHPGWVSHGVVAAPPSGIATFLHAIFNGRLISIQSLNAMMAIHDAPADVGYGLGLMGEWPRFGHNGGGPGYCASAFHAAGSNVTVCVMAAIEEGFDAEKAVLEILSSYRMRSLENSQ